MATVGERDRARGSEVSRPRTEERARRRLEARRERPGPRRSQDAETVDEALEIERDTGRREGAASRARRPIVRYGPRGAVPVDAPPEAAPAGVGASSSRRSFPTSSAGDVPGLSAPLIFETVLIAADELVNQHRAPIPSRLLIAWAFFSVLGLARGAAARPATALGWGIVVSTFYATVPGKKPAGLTALQTVGDFVAGKYGKTNAQPAGAPATVPAAPTTVA